MRVYVCEFVDCFNAVLQGWRSHFLDRPGYFLNVNQSTSNWKNRRSWCIYTWIWRSRNVQKIRFASIVLYVLLQFKLILRTLWWSDDPFEITLWVTFSVISAFLFNHITECRQENTIKTSFDKNIKKFLGVPLIHAHA